MTNPYFNSNTTGGTLQGIGELLQGLGKLRDPNASRRQQLLNDLQTNPNLRDQLIEQYQNNPDAINALLGRKPIFGQSNYDQVYNMLSGPVSPEGQAKLEAAKASTLESKNRETIATRNAELLRKGQEEVENNPQGLEPIFTKNENGTLNIKPVLGSFSNPEERAQYQELLSGKILTPQERTEQATRTTREKALTEYELGRIPGQKIKDQKDIQKIEKEDEDRIAAQSTLARVGKGNLYQAKLAGKLSNDELQHILGYEKGAQQYKDDMDAYFHNRQLGIENDRLGMEQQRLDMEKTHYAQLNSESKGKKDENAALWILEKTADPRTGMPSLSMDQARSVVASPTSFKDSEDPNDKRALAALDEVRQYKLKDQRAKISATYIKWDANLKGKKPTDNDVNNLNNDMNALSGGGFTAPNYTRKLIKTHTFKSDEYSVVRISGDNDIAPTGQKLVKLDSVPTSPIKQSGDTNSVKEVDFNTRVQQLSNLPKDEIVKTLTKEGWDVSTGNKIQAPSSKVPIKLTPATVKAKPNFKADTTGLPPVTQDSTTQDLIDLVDQALRYNYPIDYVLRKVPSERHIQAIHLYYQMMKK